MHERESSSGRAAVAGGRQALPAVKDLLHNPPPPPASFTFTARAPVLTPLAVSRVLVVIKRHFSIRSSKFAAKLDESEGTYGGVPTARRPCVALRGAVPW